MLSLVNCFLLGAVFVMAEAGYTLELELRNFSSPHHMLAIGECCHTSTVQPATTCSKPCNVAFIFCWKNHGSSSTSIDKEACQHSRGSTGVYSGLDIITFDIGNLTRNGNRPQLTNPLILNDTVWPGGIQMFIRAINDNGAQRKLIDHFRLQERLAPGSSSGLQKYYGMKNETNVIVAEFRLSCMDYFYPPNCSTFCKSQDNDQGGHYDCHPETGEKECKEGYLNPATNCTECAPASGCSPENGYCTKPNECLCHTGYGGPLCLEDYDVCGHKKPCLRGICINTVPDAYHCECPTDYYGENCQHHIGDDTPCHSFPCQNGATCIVLESSYTCSCPAGYEGENCSSDVDVCGHKSPCLNGGTCTNTGVNTYHCQCAPGFNGTNCDIAAPDSEDSEASEELPHLPVTVGCAVGGGLLLVTLVLCVVSYIARRRCLAKKRKRPTLQATSHFYADATVSASPTSPGTTLNHDIPDSHEGSTTTEQARELSNPLYAETEHYYSTISPTFQNDEFIDCDGQTQYANIADLGTHHSEQQGKFSDEKYFSGCKPSLYYNVMGERVSNCPPPLPPPKAPISSHGLSLLSRVAQEGVYSQPVDAVMVTHQLPLYHILEHGGSVPSAGPLGFSPPPVYQVLEEPPELVKAPISALYGESEEQSSLQQPTHNATAPELPDYDDIDALF